MGIVLYYGTRLQTDYKRVWLEGMKDWHGRLPVRMTDDELEEQFWREYIARKREQGLLPQPDPYAAPLLGELQALIPPGSSILEIGPGWGNYTMEMAKAAAAYACFDSSASILAYLEEASARLGIGHMEFRHGKWEAYEAEEDAFDVVFGINCYYRMQEIDRALWNMNRIARRLAVVGMTSGPEALHLREIHQQLGYPVKFARRDYIHLTNLLYQLGIDANCRIVPLERTYTFDSEEQLIDAQMKKILEPNADREAVARIVSRHIRDIDGKPGYVHRFSAALLYWEPVPEQRIIRIWEDGQS